MLVVVGGGQQGLADFGKLKTAGGASPGGTVRYRYLAGKNAPYNRDRLCEGLMRRLEIEAHGSEQRGDVLVVMAAGSYRPMAETCRRDRGLLGLGRDESSLRLTQMTKGAARQAPFFSRSPTEQQRGFLPGVRMLGAA